MKQASLVVTLLMTLTGTPGAAQKHPAADLRVPETTAARLHRELAEGRKLLVIDVRTPREYAAGHVPGSVNIPLEELRSGIEARHLPKGARIVTICERGGRSSRAARELQQWGYHATSFCRLDTWRAEGYKVKAGGPKRGPSSRLRAFPSPVRA